jgi:subtilisin-like proprotein convertase family protein
MSTTVGEGTLASLGGRSRFSMHRPVWTPDKRPRLATLLTASICLCAGALGAAPASAATFSNSGVIAINSAGPATPYPANITVAGLGATIADVNVTLSGFGHAFPADVDVLLVGPQGQSVLLMSDVRENDPFCGDDVVGVNLTFDDGAAGPIPSGAPLASGTFQPTNNDILSDSCLVGGGGDAFPGPAPSGPYGSMLAVFNGTNPNGTWNLYVVDDTVGDSGSFGGGWTLEIKPSNVFTLGAVTRNKKKGTARLTVNVPGPGELALSGNGVKTADTAGAVAAKTVPAAGKVRLLIRAKGKKKRKLNETGKVKVMPSVTFTPTGGDPSTQARKLKLKKR